MSEELEALFPNLAGSGYEITGPATRDYNCVAWAAGDITSCWDYHQPDAYWPPGIPHNHRVETVMRVFATIGYEICDGDVREPGYEKIAVYAFVGHFTHAARQLADGQWTSKLGNREVITHPTLESLAGGIYGGVYCIMRRSAAA